eukprot:Hpha_TRINITY_DN10538_c0_g1::TRINITY_DN10538_c0_g1_i1::g.31190::m.31190
MGHRGDRSMSRPCMRRSTQDASTGTGRQTTTSSRSSRAGLVWLYEEEEPSLLASRVFHYVAKSNEHEAYLHSIGTPEGDFDCVRVPQISVLDWMKMFEVCIPQSAPWAAGLILADRLLRKRGLLLGPYNAHRFGITALLVGAKATGLASPQLNKALAETSKLTMENVFRMERTFLALLEWDIGMTQRDITLTLEGLPRRAATTEPISDLGHSGLHLLNLRSSRHFRTSDQSSVSRNTVASPLTSPLKFGNLGRIDEAIRWALPSPTSPTESGPEDLSFPDTTETGKGQGKYPLIPHPPVTPKVIG